MIEMKQINLNGQRVLIREDFNVPIKQGEITSDLRIRAALPTIQSAIKSGARVILMSHLGRPEEGKIDAEYSLAPVAKRLSELLHQPVRLIRDPFSALDVAVGEVVLLENTRFLVGEKKNDMHLSKQLAALCDVFVMDAFGTAHRAEASTYGVAAYASKACAGPLLMAELTALHNIMREPARPLVVIVGGSKVSTKLSVLESLVNIADQVIVGGGIANTFLAAAGFSVGKSLYEPALIPEAKRLTECAKRRGCAIPLPTDVIVSSTFSADAKAICRLVSEVRTDEMILDIGPNTARQFATLLNGAKTILWNGPVGVFEFEPFSQGTKALAMAVAASDAYSVAGGGDTLAAVDHYAIADQLSYISTGGGAFLEALEGKTLPAVEILMQRGEKVLS